MPRQLQPLPKPNRDHRCSNPHQLWLLHTLVKSRFTFLDLFEKYLRLMLQLLLPLQLFLPQHDFQPLVG